MQHTLRLSERDATADNTNHLYFDFKYKHKPKRISNQDGKSKYFSDTNVNPLQQASKFSFS